jgi:hypothetical protein
MAVEDPLLVGSCFSMFRCEEIEVTFADGLIGDCKPSTSAWARLTVNRDCMSLK